MPPVIPTARSRFDWLPSFAALLAAWVGGLWAHHELTRGRKPARGMSRLLRIGR